MLLCRCRSVAILTISLDREKSYDAEKVRKQEECAGKNERDSEENKGAALVPRTADNAHDG